MSPSEPQREPQTPWTRLAGMGFEFGASLAGFMLLGWWVDYHWRIEGHWGLLIGTLVGLIGGTYNFIRESLLAIRQANRQGRQPQSRPSSESSGDPPHGPPRGPDDIGAGGPG